MIKNMAGNLLYMQRYARDACEGRFVGFAAKLEDVGSAEMPSPPRRENREREMLLAYGQLGDATEVINERALAVMKRMSDKLTGRDFVQVSTPYSLLFCVVADHKVPAFIPMMTHFLGTRGFYKGILKAAWLCASGPK